MAVEQWLRELKLAPKTKAHVLGRLVDPEKIIRENVYHPGFQGSFSIKYILPALVSELSYNGLDIKKGDTAVARFARVARGDIAGDAAQKTRRQLLEAGVLQDGHIRNLQIARDTHWLR